MKPLIRTSTVAILFATIANSFVADSVVFAAPHRNPAGRDAFLHYQVYSINELVSVVERDAALRQRYARHFGISQTQVVDFFKNALIVYPLPEGRQVTTYGVTRSGNIYPVSQYLRKGTKVWATRSGLPVLKWACANPLTKNLPGTLLASKPRSPRKVKRSEGAEPEIPSSALATATSPELPLPEEAPVLMTPLAPVPEEVASSLLVAPSVPVGVASSSIAPPISQGGGGPDLLPLLFLFGLGPFGHHGGGTSPSPTDLIPGGTTEIPLPVNNGEVTPTPDLPGFTDTVVTVPVERPTPPDTTTPGGTTIVPPGIAAAPEPDALPLFTLGSALLMGGIIIRRKRR